MYLAAVMCINASAVTNNIGFSNLVNYMVKKYKVLIWLSLASGEHVLAEQIVIVCFMNTFSGHSQLPWEQGRESNLKHFA